ncbi:MAG: acyltransferase [Betaproteobacteria bacterium]
MTRDTASGCAAPHHVRALDGLRGVAVLLVFCVHAAGISASVIFGADLDLTNILTLSTWPQRVLYWLQRSHHGVFLFFVLSGYLIGHMWWPQPQASYRRFVWRRTLRIYPAFLLAFAASLGYASWTGTWSPPDWWRVLGNFVFFNGAPGSRVVPFNIVTWSLFYEMTFYVLFPLVVIAALRLAPRAAWWVPALGIAVPLVAVVGGADPLVLCWSLLFCGVALAFGQGRAVATLARVPTVVVVLAYLAVTTSALFDVMPMPVAILAFACVAVLVLAKSLAGGNGIATLLAATPLVLLGRISYSFYLLHWMITMLVAIEVGRHASAWGVVAMSLVIFAGGFVLSAIAASLSWWAAERPYFRRGAIRT